jgi:hypothetical protein
MKELFILLFCLLPLQFCAAQQCKLTDLSRKYIYLVTAEKSNNEYRDLQTSKVSIEIFRKADGRSVQKLFIRSKWVDSFSECSAVRSYVTMKHAKDEGADNYWGDFIVADLNFDGREDLAIITQSSNPGSIYEFFTQSASGRFVKDPFLSEGFFPYKIDRKNKTLTTSTNATTAGYTETVLKYNPTTKKWRVVRDVHRKGY